jgi:hypothetical protein
MGTFTKHQYNTAPWPPHTPPRARARARVILLKPSRVSLSNVFDFLHGCEICPLQAHFRRIDKQEVTQSEIRRILWMCDDRMFLSAWNYCTTSDMWLGVIS